MNQTHIHPAASGFAALERGGVVVPFSFEGRNVQSHDVAIRILFCGICHSDIHYIHEWGEEFPLVPGHEIVDEVTGIGSEVSRFSVGDKVMVGTIVDSCRTCQPWRAEMEIFSISWPT